MKESAKKVNFQILLIFFITALSLIQTAQSQYLTCIMTSFNTIKAGQSGEVDVLLATDDDIKGTESK